jgi:glutamine synthetase
VKTVNIEAQLMLQMAQRMILPAAIRYQGEVAQAVTSAKSAGADPGATADVLKTLTSAIGDFQKNIAALEKATSHHAEGDAYQHAKHGRDHVLPAMLELRKAGDKLEGIVADDLWPLPTYREMLFIR